MNTRIEYLEQLALAIERRNKVLSIRKAILKRGEKVNNQKIADEVGISRERVRQIIKQELGDGNDSKR